MTDGLASALSIGGSRWIHRGIRPELFACSLPLSCVTTRGRRRTVMTGHHQPEDSRTRRSLSGVRRPEEKTRSDSSPGGFSYGRGVDREIARSAPAGPTECWRVLLGSRTEGLSIQTLTAMESNKINDLYALNQNKKFRVIDSSEFWRSRARIQPLPDLRSMKGRCWRRHKAWR